MWSQEIWKNYLQAQYVRQMMGAYLLRKIMQHWSVVTINGLLTFYL